MSRKILIIGPSINHSKGGMATVIEGIVTDSKLNSKHSIDAHESYSDGNIIYRIIFSIIAHPKLFVNLSQEISSPKKRKSTAFSFCNLR